MILRYIIVSNNYLDGVTFVSFELYVRKIICLVFQKSDQLNSCRVTFLGVLQILFEMSGFDLSYHQ